MNFLCTRDKTGTSPHPLVRAACKNKYSAFTFTHQVFVGKGPEYDPLRAMQAWNMDFWDPPEVILASIQVL